MKLIQKTKINRIKTDEVVDADFEEVKSEDDKKTPHNLYFNL